MQDLILKAISPNINRAIAAVASERTAHPSATNRQIAERFLRGTSYRLGTTGFISGLPSNPAYAVPAGVAESLTTINEQMQLAARIALIYDPDFFDSESAVEELLVPILGAAKVGELLRNAAVKASGTITRRLIRDNLKGAALKQFKKLVLKYLGLKITQRALITKTIPVVGGFIGGAWNFGQTRTIGFRVIDFMEV